MGRLRAVIDSDVLERVLGVAVRTGAEFAEVYAEDRRSTAVGLDDGKVEQVTSGRVTATAEVVEVDGRRHTFAVQAIDEQGEIARGVVVRVLVDRDRFMSSLG